MAGKSSMCSVEGCADPRQHRTWCLRHYNRWLKTGVTDDATTRIRTARYTHECVVCGSAFTSRSTLSLVCSPRCRRQRKQEYDSRRYDIDREEIVARAVKWQKDNVLRSRGIGSRRRARKRSNGTYTVTPRDLRRLLHRFRNRCAYCDVPVAIGDNLHLDHVLPISRGGAHSIGNLLPTCAWCNQSKRTKYLAEWRRDQCNLRIV